MHASVLLFCNSLVSLSTYLPRPKEVFENKVHILKASEMRPWC